MLRKRSYFGFWCRRKKQWWRHKELFVAPGKTPTFAVEKGKSAVTHKHSRCLLIMKASVLCVTPSTISSTSWRQGQLLYYFTLQTIHVRWWNGFVVTPTFSSGIWAAFSPKWLSHCKSSILLLHRERYWRLFDQWDFSTRRSLFCYVMYHLCVYMYEKVKVRSSWTYLERKWAWKHTFLDTV